MTLALLMAVAALLAWRQLSTPQDLTRQFVVGALGRWALGFLGVRIIASGVIGPGGPLGTLGSGRPQALLEAAVGAGFALLLWGGLVDLALRPLGRREARWVVAPSALLTALLTIIPGVPAAVVCVPAIPLLFRCRWKQSLSGGFRLLLFLGALAILVAGAITIQLTTAPLADPGGVTRALRRLTDVATWLARAQLLLLLPRLLGGRIVYFRSIQRRLVLSHLLIGLVPLLLALVFWGVLSYVSVGTDRAQTAVRRLETESANLKRHLEAALRSEEGAVPSRVEARLRDRYPAIRIYPQVGGRVVGLEGVAPWPDSLVDHGLVVIGLEAYFGVIARRAAPAPAIVALTPLENIVEAQLGPELRAELRFLPHSEVRTRRGGVQLSTGADRERRLLDSLQAIPRPREGDSAAADSLGTGGTGESSAFRVSGAATLPVLRAGADGWRAGSSLLTAWVPFKQAAIGLAIGLRENPFAVVPLAILGFLAFLLALLENFTVRMVIGLSQSITAAVAALRRATVALKSGNPGYRIPIRPEDNDELWTVAQSFNTMAAGLEEAREAERERERLEKELQLARQIQARLLPDHPPAIDGLDLSGLSFSAQQVGGDYYDFIPLADGRLGLIIADVSGKGIPASLLMSAFRASLLSQALDDATPGAVLERVNWFLHRSVEPGRFVTAFLAFLNPGTGALEYSNAGHNPPFVFPGATGRPSPLEEGGVMLGAFETGHWRTARAQLAPGDLLVLYTDGVTEAQNEAGEFWDEEGLLDFVEPRRAATCDRLAPEILAEVRRFEGEHGPSDDITLLLARRMP